MESAFDRLLRAAIELKPGVIANKSDLAKFLNESPQSITNWQSRGIPKGKVLDVARAIGVSPEWLASGSGPMLAGGISPEADEIVAALQSGRAMFSIRPDLGQAITTPLRPVVVVESDNESLPGMIVVPRYTVKASAGHGEPVLEIDTEGQPNYCRSGWAQRNGYKPENLFSIVASGDSMEPTIPDGASMIVHRQEEVVSGKVHVICRGDECYVKRLIRQLDGSVLVKSENPDYKDVEVLPDDPTPLHVVGLVVSVSFNL